MDKIAHKNIGASIATLAHSVRVVYSSSKSWYKSY